MNFQDFISFVFKILFFFVIGIIISIFADNIGKKIGKKKVVLFNLRPRYTSMIITAISGGLIAVLSSLILSLLSQDAKTYLFQMNKLKQEIYIYKQEVNKLKQRYEELLSEVNLLITMTHLGDILFIKDQPVFIKSIENNKNIEKEIYHIIQEANESIKQKYIYNLNLKQTQETIYSNLIRIDKNQLSNIVKKISFNNNRKYVLLFLANRNIFLGEYVDVNLYLLEDKLILKKNSILGEVEISNPEDIEQTITLILKELNDIQQELIKKGKIPTDNTIGGNISLADIINTAIEIKNQAELIKNKQKFKILLINQNDIYIANKFNLEIKIMVYK